MPINLFTVIEYVAFSHLELLFTTLILLFAVTVYFEQYSGHKSLANKDFLHPVQAA